MTRARQGLSLVEVLVALPLIALLGVVAVRLLLAVYQQTLQVEGAIGAAREVRHAASVLAAELRVIRPVDLVAWSDTAVEFEGTVGVGITCAWHPGRTQLLLLGADSATRLPDALSTTWNQPPQPGDRVGYWLAGASPTDSLRAAEGTVRAIASSQDCAQSPLIRSRTLATLRLTLLDSIAGNVATGTPVRVTRRTRFSLYRAGDGDWYLGRRTRSAIGWDVVQPVAGPLQSARDRGLELHVHDQQGSLLDSTAAAAATRASIVLRAPRRSGRASPRIVTVDSVFINVAFRADRSGDA
ncbi:MAG: hypothetical protein ABMA00_07215 [Gemmatimonas sp.]